MNCSLTLRKTNAVPPLVDRHFLFEEHQARLHGRKIKMPTSAAAAFGLTVHPFWDQWQLISLSANKLIKKL
jgi:hypothetical protein